MMFMLILSILLSNDLTAAQQICGRLYLGTNSLELQVLHREYDRTHNPPIATDTIRTKKFNDISFTQNIQKEENNKIIFFLTISGVDQKTGKKEIFARLNYSLINSKHIDMGYTNTRIPFRQNGISKLLYQEMLRLNPNVNVISKSLKETNLTIFKRNLKKPFNNEHLIAAIKQTPAYRSLLSFGFTTVKIAYFSENTEGEMEISFDVFRTTTNSNVFE